MGDEPLEPLVITGAVEEVVKFDAKEWIFPMTTKEGPGFEGSIKWDTNVCGYGAPESADGFIKIRKVWERKGEDGIDQLFEVPGR